MPPNRHEIATPLAETLFDAYVALLRPYDATPQLAEVAATVLAEHTGLALTWLCQELTPEDRLASLERFFHAVEQVVLRTTGPQQGPTP